MPLPRFGGYGLGRGAEYSRHAQSLGQFAGMDLPSLGAYSGSGSTHAGHSFGRTTGYTAAGQILPAGGMARLATTRPPPGHSKQQPGHLPDYRRLLDRPTPQNMRGMEKAVRQAGRRFQAWNASRGGPSDDGNEPEQPERLAISQRSGWPEGPRGIGPVPQARPQGPVQGWPRVIEATATPAGALGPATARPGPPAPTARPMGPVRPPEAGQMPLPGMEDLTPGAPVKRSRRDKFGSRGNFVPPGQSLF